MPWNRQSAWFPDPEPSRSPAPESCSREELALSPLSGAGGDAASLPGLGPAQRAPAPSRTSALAVHLREQEGFPSPRGAPPWGDLAVPTLWRLQGQSETTVPCRAVCTLCPAPSCFSPDHTVGRSTSQGRPGTLCCPSSSHWAWLLSLAHPWMTTLTHRYLPSQA